MNKAKGFFSFFILSFSCLFFSCDGLFDGTESKGNDLPQPVIKVNASNVTISCNASATDNILYINVYRKLSAEGEYINIAQIIPDSGNFTNSVQFVDSYIENNTKYDYKIRYAKKTESGDIDYVNTAAQTITTSTGATGELELTEGVDSLTDASGVEFTFDTETYLLTLKTPAAFGSNATTDPVFCLVISNGKKIIPIELTTDFKLNLRNALSTDFLDVPLNIEKVIAQIKEEDKINKYTTYTWSIPVKITIKDSSGATQNRITVPVSSATNSNLDYSS